MGRPVHKKLILPGEVEKRDRLQIFVPSGYEEPEQAIGHEHVLVCSTCDRVYRLAEEREFQAHVGDCARVHMDLILSASPRRRMPILDEETWDPEVAEHMRKVGDRMLEEGRLEVRRNERAGF